MGKSTKLRRKVTKPFSKKPGSLTNLKLRWARKYNEDNDSSQPESDVISGDPGDSKIQLPHQISSLGVERIVNESQEVTGGQVRI